MAGEFDRILFFEHARNAAEAAYATDPLDADNLTRWGSALLELSSFQQPGEAKKMIQEAITKLEEALEINPKKAETLWCLGNALISSGFLLPDAEDAGIYFMKANGYFTKACDEDPGNELYSKSLEISAKAPELHAEIHKHGFDQSSATAPSGPSASSDRGAKKSSDLNYDIMGWVILAVGIVAWVGFANSRIPAPPPTPS